VQTFSGARHYFTILPTKWPTSSTQLSHDENSTLFMLLLAVFNILLYIYSRQTDIAVGTPVAGRSRKQVEGVLGLFINTLVMRSQLDPSGQLPQLLAAGAPDRPGRFRPSRRAL
jgi:non-ribosomal peptide synthetase component F